MLKTKHVVCGLMMMLEVVCEFYSDDIETVEGAMDV